jgi:putative Holliday junction resolvase
MAQPLQVIDKSRDSSDIRKISELVNEYGVDEVVVGLPISLSGEIGPQAREVLDFVEELKKTLSVPVATWDERLTTSYAERALKESNVKRGRRKEIIDKVAAAVMLQGFLDLKNSRG